MIVQYLMQCKSLENCSSRGNLGLLPWYHFDIAVSTGSYHVYNAVYAVAHTMHKMLIQEIDIQGVKNGGSMDFPPLKVMVSLLIL